MNTLFMHAMQLIRQALHLCTHMILVCDLHPKLLGFDTLINLVSIHLCYYQYQSTF